MAKVTIQQAYEACENNDKGLIASYAKRYPLAMVTLALIVNSGDEHTKDFLFGIPTTMSMNRIEKVMETGVKVEDISDDDDDAEEVKENAPVKPQEADTEEKPKKRRGRPKKAEEPVETFVEDAEEEIEEVPEEDTEIMNEPVEEDEPEEEQLEGYAAMNAVELFKLCKSRGISTMPKQKAAVYIELLEADDAKNSDLDDSGDDDDDWDI